MKHLVFLVACYLLLAPFVADAATVRVVLPETVNAGDTFTAEVFLDTEGENINAVEGSVLFPDTLTISEIRYGGSVVSLWLSAPAERTPGVVDFAGVLPGGYQASPERMGKGNMFTLVFSAEKEGTASVSFGAETNVYLNDGEGTKLQASKAGSEVSVVSSGAPASVSPGDDTYPPEAFSPDIVPGSLYGMEGDVLVFSTQDKDSGVRGYDVGFSYIGFLPEFLVSFVPAESPYPISKEVSGKYIFVRAADTQGNVRTAVVPPHEPGFASFFLTWGLPAGVLLFVLFLFFAVFFAKRKVSLR